MAWYEEAVFYHIYPLGLLGAPERNDHIEIVHRLPDLKAWIDHMKAYGFNALYLGPCFSSGLHGYDTADYRKVDERLGTNEDLAELVRYCHEQGVRVVLDAVFNHTGREFFAFEDIKEKRGESRFLNWYCRVDLWGNNEYDDGFSYENWGGHNLLPKLNLYDQEVKNYHFDTVRFWIHEFDIDGLRLDAADVLDEGFMRELRGVTSGSKQDFWLMGEVIHGEYGRWVNGSMLHSVTNYALHKALYSAHNDHNYFEIAHTIRRQRDMGLGDDVHLYNFADNHDVERIMTRLSDRRHFFPLHILLYTLPGIPSVYYGSEFGIEGRKERGSDASLRPALRLDEMPLRDNDPLRVIGSLGKIYNEESALWYAGYNELQLTTTKYAFARGDVIITVTNSDAEESFDLPCGGSYTGALTGREICADDSRLRFTLPGNSGEIWIPSGQKKRFEPLTLTNEADAHEDAYHEDAYEEMPKRAPEGKSLEEMTIEELQAEVLSRLASNGPLTDRMKREVKENIYRNSLINWIKSFH